MLRASLFVLLAACAPHAQVCDATSNTCHDADGWSGLAPLDRHERVEQTAGVDGIEVLAEAWSTAGFELTIKNTTDEAISFLVEDSSFTLAVTKEPTRIVRGATVAKDAHRPQLPEELAPHASANMVVKFTKLRLSEETEEKVNNLAPKVYEIKDTDRQKQKGEELEAIAAKNRIILTCAIVGGSFSLVFKGANGPQTWTGTVQAAGAPPPDPVACEALFKRT